MSLRRIHGFALAGASCIAIAGAVALAHAHALNRDAGTAQPAPARTLASRAIQPRQAPPLREPVRVGQLPVPQRVTPAPTQHFVGRPGLGAPFVGFPHVGPPFIGQPALAQVIRSGIGHPATIPGPLTGQPTAWDLAHRRPLAVMVENYSPDSRPQTGLNAASLIFETVAEGGITRFMPVYLEHDAPMVGPVRSTRIYFNAWANGLHAILVHAGGNDDAQAQLFTLPNISQLDEIAYEDANFIAHVPFFSRSSDRLMPHNLYTYPPKIRYQLQFNKIQLSGNFPVTLAHREPNAPLHRPIGGTLDLNFSSPDYAVAYQYDHASNRYLRWMGGTAHIDASTGHQLAPSNVVVLMASIAPDPFGGVANPGAVYVQSTGANTAYYFRDGYRYKGSWRKAHGGNRLQLLDDHGRPFAFNPGQTWIEVLPDTGSMSWTAGKR